MEKPLNNKSQEESTKKNIRRDISIILFIGGIIFFSLTLATFSPSDPSIFTQPVFPGQKINNFFGKVGSHVASLLFQGFGLSAFLIPLYLIIFLFSSHFLKNFSFRWYKLIFFIVSLISLSAILSGLFPQSGFFGMKIPLGGIVGFVTITYLNEVFNLSGSVFFLFIFFVIFTILAFEKNIFSRIFVKIYSLLKLLKKTKTIKESSTRIESRPPRVVKTMQKEESRNIEEEIKKEPEVNDAKEPELPPLSLLAINKEKSSGPSEAELKENCSIIEECFRYFDVKGRITEVHPGPVITMYEFVPEPGTKISKILSLEHEISMALKAISIRIIAPIPGKASVGIEVSNKRIATVYLREIIGSESFANKHLKIPLALGKDTTGEPYVSDLTRMPHLLIAGSTGSGKSVSVNGMIVSILYKMTPRDAKFIMIDPKMLELSLYKEIPHLLYPVVTNPEEAGKVLRWAIKEMERRYELMANSAVRNIEQYNAKITKENPTLFEQGDSKEKLPYIVIIIDELADLMMVSPKEVETSITRLAQMARAAGIHMIVATQRPSVDVITGLIKANFPARIAFKVASKIDSRTILDANGADSLLGQGDMLYLPPATSQLIRLHGPLVTEEEIQSVVNFWKKQYKPQYIEISDDIMEEKEDGGDEFDDDKYEEAVRIVRETRQASISLIQRRLRIGYNRAARLIERMEKEGIVGPPDGSKPREVLIR
ncbi:MAG: DNA translocase FtsK 4TM domain-containing protein [Proteobacteria bacterium]|nr:DNA translocase FtsK 4TM domain-containing protein [Pseudomonadota bacterium]